MKILVALSSMALASTVATAQSRIGAITDSADSRPPSFLLGNFQDDYGAKFTVSASEFIQQPRNRYHVIAWHVRDQYFIARNDSLNTSAANRYTRIDWMPLAGMAPFDWAFCFSAYEAPTQAEAEAVTIANRESPRTGCNKFPFSRMRRMSP